jgi:hypothetical protein
MPKRRRPEFIPADPNSPDENVKLPRQARVEVERAEALVAGRSPRPVAVDVVSLTNAQIDGVLERLDQGELSISDPDPGVVLALIREGARRIKADRQKAQTPKAQAAQKAKDAAIKQRLKLVIEAVIELPPTRKYLTGGETIKRLVRVVSRRLRDSVTEATIRHDIRDLRSFLRFLQKERIKTVKWEPAEREQLRNAAMVMRVQFEDAVFRFNKALKRLNPKCNRCIPYNWHHTPNYWGSGQSDCRRDEGGPTMSIFEKR